MLHKCGISPRRKRFNQRAQPLWALWKYSVVCVCVRLHAYVVWVGLGLLLSLAVSLHLSHDFPDLGSPGVSHLGHQLHLQVNCSSKWSAKQCRKKEEPPPCSHHQCMTRSDQKAGNKQANEWCERIVEALKMDEENVLKKKKKDGRNRNLLYIFASRVPLWIIKWVQQAFFFSSRSPVGETVLTGQINWRAFARRPHRLMKRPRGYLQGHTKELVEMLTENWTLSGVPWVALYYCRPCF